MTLHLTDSRIGATVLAALRNHQISLNSLPGDLFASCLPDLFEIASDGGKLAPLTVEEIDDLCEKLNAGGGVMLDRLPASAALIERARADLQTDECEFDDDALSSPSDDGGTWVQGWLWVPDQPFTVTLIADDIQVTADSEEDAERFARSDALEFANAWRYRVESAEPSRIPGIARPGCIEEFDPTEDAAEAFDQLECTTEGQGKQALWTYRATFEIVAHASDRDSAIDAAFALLGAPLSNRVEG